MALYLLISRRKQVRFWLPLTPSKRFPCMEMISLKDIGVKPLQVHMYMPLQIQPYGKWYEVLILLFTIVSLFKIDFQHLELLLVLNQVFLIYLSDEVNQSIVIRLVLRYQSIYYCLNESYLATVCWELPLFIFSDACPLQWNEYYIANVVRFCYTKFPVQRCSIFCSINARMSNGHLGILNQFQTIRVFIFFFISRIKCCTGSNYLTRNFLFCPVKYMSYVWDKKIHFLHWSAIFFFVKWWKWSGKNWNG